MKRILFLLLNPLGRWKTNEAMAKNPWVVHKFGGTSVANSDRYRNVVTILEKEPGDRKAVVVSAMSGVTDRLLELVELAKKQDPAYTEKLQSLRQKHLETLQSLVPPEYQLDCAKNIETDSSAIQDLLKAIWLSKSCSELTQELIAGFGEVWSAQMLHAYLRSQERVQGSTIQWLDARKVLIVHPGETGPVVDWQASRFKLQEWLAKNPASLLIITGYVASTPDGIATTLKRNGSDFSASIFGKLLEASTITIWTDVDGVLSADPRRVPEAEVLDEMSYQEAVELAYFGAKVLHPHTMAPAFDLGIPIWIRNTLNSKHPGTKIHAAQSRSGSQRPVKGFSTVDRVAMINVEGTGMIGVPGVASRLFGALREVGVSVIMISQASSEHSICFAVPEAQGALAKSTVEKAFYSELHQGQIQAIELLPNCSILAAVGDGMVESPGVSAKFFQSLGKAGINVRAIAQGSSERNISAVIDQADATRALRAVHAGFYLSAQTLSVGIIGPGLIGKALLKQLEAQAPLLQSQFKIDLRIRGVSNSKKMLLADPRLQPSSNQDLSVALDSGVPMDIDVFVRHVHADHLPHSVIIDCSSSEEIAGRYEQWLEKGIHVITPNKKANSGTLAYYKSLRAHGQKRGSHYLYEATVGAGLPVITTLRDLIRTGDQVLTIEGILSGTLSYLFNSFSEKTSFSSIVREAKKLGYTEPDPRDDLSGRDVARKLIILGREMGLPLEMSDLSVQSLVPLALQNAKSPDEFLNGLTGFDGEMAKLRDEAASQGEVLRYVGVVHPNGKSSVELKRYPVSHPFARVQGTDNIIAFTTSRYRHQPLIVQGPGAGPEVTAGGVFADLLRLAAFLGASSS
jgi:aspartokinase/homoserine dehydrogenase 1